jgi:hypothetical protein
MPQLDGFLRDRSPLNADQKRRIRELTADWQLLADLSFADLILWVPLRKDFKSWPTGYVAVAHIRPTTAATVFPQDVIGDEITWGARPRIDQALSGALNVSFPAPHNPLFAASSTCSSMYLHAASVIKSSMAPAFGLYLPVAQCLTVRSFTCSARASGDFHRSPNRYCPIAARSLLFIILTKYTLTCFI